MPFTWSSSLRSRALALVAAAFVPAAALGVLSAREERERALAAGEASLRTTATASASRARSSLEKGLELLRVLAEHGDVRRLDAAACDPMLARLLAAEPLYANIGVVGPGSTIECSALPFERPLSAADRPYLRRALERRRFAIGESQVGRITLRQTINLALPVYDASGDLMCVPFVALDGERLGSDLEATPRPEGSVLTLFDRNGTIVARAPDPERLAGTSHLDAPLVREVMERERGTIEVEGVDGLRRLYAFAPIDVGGDEGFYLSLGMPKDAFLAPVDAAWRRELALLGLAGITVVTVAWIASTRLIVRPVRELQRAAERLRAGDLEARVELPRAGAELGELARSFDQMAAALGQRIAAQERAEAEARALNRELERRVADRTTELQRANEDLESFAYTVSHDLRAPLRAMSGFASILSDEYARSLDPEGREFAARIVASAGRMDQLIQDLLTYSRLGRGEVPLARLDVGAVVGEALSQLAGEIEARGAGVEVDGSGADVRSNHGVLVQVLANLVSNALKFVAPGQRPRVRVRAEPRGARVRIWVEDDGIGIAEEHRERIFRVFERLHGVEAYPGTGIGLAIVKRGAARLGGTCGVESAPGRGSRFWVDLPGPGETG